MNDQPDEVPDRVKAIADAIAHVDAAYTNPLSQDPRFVEVLKQATNRIESKDTSKKQIVRMRNHLLYLKTAVSSLDEVIAETQTNAQVLRALFSDVLIRSFLIGCGIDGTKVEKFNKAVESRRTGASNSNAAQKKKADEGYKTIVRTLATAITSEGQELTTNMLIGKVIASWPPGTAPKSVPTVRKVIERMEADSLIKLVYDGRKKKKFLKVLVVLAKAVAALLLTLERV